MNLTKKILRTKVNSSAIQFALILSVIIALLLGGLILFSGVNKNLQTQFKIQEQVMLNATSGIEYGKAFSNELSLNSPQFIRLYDEGVDSVEITKKNWGAYLVFLSKGHHKNYEFQKIAMVGQQTKGITESLYLADLGNPLSVCGKTRLSGKCAIPKRGIKRAYIAGQNYIGNRLVYGTSTVSESQLPSINKSILSQINTPFLVEQLAWEQKDSIVNSFSNDPVYYYENGPINLSNIFVKGQVIIESADSIFVSKSAELDNVILRSPVVHFEQGFIGQVQVFSDYKIRLENDVILKYPSVLGLIELAPKAEVSGIEIGENSKVLGSVFLTSEKPDFRKEIRLDIQKGAAIFGLAYCNGKTQVKGKINGHLFTKKFYLKTASSSYENHLLNAEIYNDLPEAFVLIPLLDEFNKYVTLTWLN